MVCSGASPASRQVIKLRAEALALATLASLASTFALLRRVLLRARVAASSSSFLPAFARVVPANPGRPGRCSSRASGPEDSARRSAP